ncbi:hypothetical protein [Leptothrix ochracea]|uniref:hypothetical protein n=1 Tax=Leptothrix ochracea TaxID=735331 RepID=UPI0034E25920
MVQFQVSAGVAQPQYGFVPSHKISVTDGSDTFTYWYVQDPATARAFNSQEDRDLVELMHAKGQAFQLGQFESFAIGTDRNYHLQRLTIHEFLIKSLR